MTEGRQPIVRMAACLVLALSAVPVAAADRERGDVTVRAAAGLGGIARAGRRMPVTVTVESAGAAFTGTVEATLDNQRVTRDVVLTGVGRRSLELYLIAPDTDTATVRVRLSAGGTAVDVPVRIVPGDAPFTLCVAAAGVAPPGFSCTVSMEAAALPVSWRGLEAADDMVWAPAARAALPAEQRLAVARAIAVRTWNSSTNMAPAARPLPPADGLRGNPVLPLFVLLLAAAVAAAPRLSRRPAVLYATTGLLIGIASAAALADGRLGSGARLQVRETIVVRTGDGLAGAQLLARGRAIFPAAGPYTAAASLEDAEATVQAPARAATAARAGTIRGAAAKRAALEYGVDGFYAEGPVRISWNGAHAIITNTLSTPLTACAATGVVSSTPAVTIAPGASVQIPLSDDTVDPVLTCDMQVMRPSLEFQDSAIDVRAHALLTIDLRQPQDAR